MQNSIREIAQQALNLSAQDRASLAHALLQSLDPGSDEGVEEAWRQELLKRDERVRSGKTSERPAFEALDEVKARFS